MIRQPFSSWIKQHPGLYDFAKRCSRFLPFFDKEPIYRFLEGYSRRRNDKVRFLQIGANDGLHNDPLREFVVNYHWSGLFVEPLPSAFELLKKNYGYLKRTDLKFINAAVSSDANAGGRLEFWTVKSDFLETLPRDRQLEILRGSSFSREHLARILKPVELSKLVGSPVELKTIDDLVSRHFEHAPNIVIIDAEGHEVEIIPSIDFDRYSIDTVVYESHALGHRANEVEEHLVRNGFSLSRLGGDTAASRL